MKIENLIINIGQSEKKAEESEIFTSQEKREMLVDVLRCASMDDKIIGQKVIIPDSCEKYGFVEGNYMISDMIHFLADMLE